MWVSAKAVSVGSNEHWSKSSIETYTLPHVGQVASGHLLYATEHPKPVLFGQNRGMGWGGRMYTYGRFMLMYGSNHHNIVQQLSPNEK